jgi:hypothetical protein
VSYKANQLTTEIVLFILRLLSSLLLIALLFALFIVLWRDYRSAAAQAEATRRSYGRLLVLEDQDGAATPTTKAYPLLPLTSLGRSPTNTIIIEDTFASGEHALIALRNGVWWLEDRQSRNGTTLNGIAVTEPVIITDGDILGIGGLQFRVELDE